jgi:hypothetical protein
LIANQPDCNRKEFPLAGCNTNRWFQAIIGFEVDMESLLGNLEEVGEMGVWK